jgi:putative transport protein
MASLSVPWIGFPAGYAASGVLLTMFGYVAMGRS